jgi:hypothetical protein
MCELFFTSNLDRTYRDVLEQMFCYNTNQAKIHDAILYAVERYGTPRVSLLKDRLWVTFESGIEAQSLFVMERSENKAELVGVLVYTRENDTLAVIFMAVREDYAHGGDRDDRMLLLRMVDEVRSMARRVKGITSITMFFRGPVTVRIQRRVANSDVRP